MQHQSKRLETRLNGIEKLLLGLSQSGNKGYQRNQINNDFICAKNARLATQKEIIFKYLLTHVATASMISAATGIPQKNICRYKRSLEKKGKLWEVFNSACKETGCNAWYLTTNVGIIKTPNQRNLLGY